MQTKLDWRDVGAMDRYDREREFHRRRYQRITYDCIYARPCGNNRVKCTRGKILSRLSNDGTVYLLFVIRGRTSFACKNCRYFVPNNN